LVGIVLVSHSAELARGLAALAGQVAGSDVRIEPAGGDPDGGLGTTGTLVELAMPTSISPSGSSKIGFPAAGGVQEERATPNERERSFTLRARAATSVSESPRSAAAPAIFSAKTVAPTPRRPAV
jgi:hypothetical protein